MKEARFNMIRRRRWQEEGAHFYHEFQRKTYSRSLADPDDTRNGNNKKIRQKGNVYGANSSGGLINAEITIV